MELYRPKSMHNGIGGGHILHCKKAALACKLDKNRVSKIKNKTSMFSNFEIVLVQISLPVSVIGQIRHELADRVTSNH